MRKRFIILGSLALSLTFFNSCEKDKDETGTTTSSTTASTTSTTATTTSSTTSGSTTEGTTTTSTTSGSTTTSSTTGGTTSSTGLTCTPTSSEVLIGVQTWTTINLDVDKFSNGDVIPEAKTDADWNAAYTNKTPAWCYYESSVDSGVIYGKLYNWYAVTDSRGLAPTGWHVPTHTEWTTLSTTLGGEGEAGYKMKNTCGWYKGGKGGNSSGFAGLPGGFRDYDGAFYCIVDIGYWWTAQERIGTTAWYRYLSSNNDFISTNDYAFKGRGMSVRCVKN